MAFLSWTKAFSVNIAKMDEQHETLFSKINELHAAISHGKDRHVIGEILNGVANYTMTHFASEEDLMALHQYPGLATHRLEHQALAQKVRDFQEKYKAGSVTLSMDVMKFLQDWLSHHINGSDKNYGAFLNSKGVS